MSSRADLIAACVSASEGTSKAASFAAARELIFRRGCLAGEFTVPVCYQDAPVIVYDRFALRSPDLPACDSILAQSSPHYSPFVHASRDE
jgi:hypothetical protein